MKRSEINAALREMEQMVREYRFALPPFCGFTPEEWAEKGHEYDEIRDNMLGWDITDYGMGDFDKMGFSLITLRNGNLTMCTWISFSWLPPYVLHNYYISVTKL